MSDDCAVFKPTVERDFAPLQHPNPDSTCIGVLHSMHESPVDVYRRYAASPLGGSCRPVTSGKVDDDMPLIGIPSFIKPAGPEASRSTHYFVSIRGCSAAAAAEASEGETKAEEGLAVTEMRTTMTRSQPSVCLLH